MSNKFRVQDGIVFPDGTELTSKSSDSIVNGDYSLHIQSDGSITIPQGDGTQTNRGQIFSDNESSFINMDVQFNTDITGGMRLGTGTQKPVDIITYANDEGGARQWRFGAGGNLTLPTGAVLGDTEEDGGVTLKSSANSYVELGSHDSNVFVWVADKGYYSGEESSFIIATAYTGADHRWKFDATANLTLPGGGIINDSSSTGTRITASNPNPGVILLSHDNNNFLKVTDEGVVIDYNNHSSVHNTWWFDAANTAIQFPDNTRQTTAYRNRPLTNLNLDGGGASTVFEIDLTYVECGGSYMRGVLPQDIYDGYDNGSTQTSFDKVLDGGQA